MQRIECCSQHTQQGGGWSVFLPLLLIHSLTHSLYLSLPARSCCCFVVWACNPLTSLNAITGFSQAQHTRVKNSPGWIRIQSCSTHNARSSNNSAHTIMCYVLNKGTFVVITISHPSRLSLRHNHHGCISSCIVWSSICTDSHTRTEQEEMDLIASRLVILVVLQGNYPRRYVIRNVVCCMTAAYDPPQTESSSPPGRRNTSLHFLQYPLATKYNLMLVMDSDWRCYLTLM